MSLCVIEIDVLKNQIAFYDLKTEVLHLRGNSYNTVYYYNDAKTEVLCLRGKSYNAEYRLSIKI